MPPWPWMPGSSAPFAPPPLCTPLLSKEPSVVYSIRILKYDPAGYLDFYLFGSDWITFSFQPDPNPVIQMK